MHLLFVMTSEEQSAFPFWRFACNYVSVNKRIAQQLLETADLLARRNDGNPHRIRAYRQAAEHLLRLPLPIQEIFREEGELGVRNALNVGERLAGAVREIILGGRFPLLERLRASGPHGTVLETVPGLGPVWVKHLQQDLGIATLEDLEAAAYDGRLEHASGMGAKRLAGIRDSLTARLDRVRPTQVATSETPSVTELLDVDREYREAVAAGRLRMIAPRRFNPTHSAWLPILRTQRGERRYTALFSNTARAHQSGRTNDWVVIYEEGAGSSAQSCTIITSRRGPLAGHRIARGREDECAALFREREPASSVQAA